MPLRHLSPPSRVQRLSLASVESNSASEIGLSSYQNSMNLFTFFVMPIVATLTLGAACASAETAYLGPAGSWTHQACLDLFGDQDKLIPMSREQLFAADEGKKIDRMCIPVTTSAVGVTPYIDEVLAMKDVRVVAEYPKMLGYSLLARPGATRENIRTVLAHPVALEEVKPWLDKEMPTVTRRAAASGGAAAQDVANSNSLEMASMGPKVGTAIYGLVSLADGIEEGPQNVTRWWVLGRTLPAPTGKDKTTLLASTTDHAFASLLSSFSASKVTILDIYERPSKLTLDSHNYVIEVEGHAQVGAVKRLLANRADLRLIGSYPRRY